MQNGIPIYVFLVICPLTSPNPFPLPYVSHRLIKSKLSTYLQKSISLFHIPAQCRTIHTLPLPFLFLYLFFFIFSFLLTFFLIYFLFFFLLLTSYSLTPSFLFYSRFSPFRLSFLAQSKFFSAPSLALLFPSFSLTFPLFLSISSFSMSTYLFHAPSTFIFPNSIFTSFPLASLPTYSFFFSILLSSQLKSFSINILPPFNLCLFCADFLLFLFSLSTLITYTLPLSLTATIVHSSSNFFFYPYLSSSFFPTF